ncbi:MAG: hypothetical protein BWY28_02549 [bacterium ADurb.Bin236]|nr:MAG: hypothetical protein BWY28_02549 [bacterium ADurb.Bin236]
MPFVGNQCRYPSPHNRYKRYCCRFNGCVRQYQRHISRYSFLFAVNARIIAAICLLLFDKAPYMSLLYGIVIGAIFVCRFLSTLSDDNSCRFRFSSPPFCLSPTFKNFISWSMCHIAISLFRSVLLSVNPTPSINSSEVKNSTQARGFSAAIAPAACRFPFLTYPIQRASSLAPPRQIAFHCGQITRSMLTY